MQHHGAHHLARFRIEAGASRAGGPKITVAARAVTEGAHRAARAAGTSKNRVPEG
jgi:hypothetical protein